jgi:uncharacterized protein YndB with AHSA1/START domain
MPPEPRNASIDIVTSTEIRRPAETVWPYLVDWEHLDRWMREAREFRVTSGTREGVGVEADATIRIAGITTHDRIRVTRWDPPWILEIAHLGWVKGTGYMELSPTEQGCGLFWREQLVPPWGLPGRLGMRTMRPVMRRIFQRDLEELRKLVESGPWPG